MKTSEVLNRAADLIEERGWITGSGWDHEAGGPLCLEGAIFAAANVRSANRYSRCPAYTAVRDYLADQTDKPPFLWNDNLPYVSSGPSIGAWIGGSREAAEEFGKQTVIATLRAAAVIEAAKEPQLADSTRSLADAKSGEAARVLNAVADMQAVSRG